MRILMVDLFSPGNAYTEELVKAMKCRNMTVLCRTDSTDFGDGIKQIKKLYGGGGTSKLKAAFKYFVGLLSLVRCLKGYYDIVHVQAFKNAKIEMRLYERRSKNVKLMHTVHNILPHEVKEEDYKLYSCFYEKCDALIVHNEESRSQLIQQFNISENKINVVPHGAYNVEAPVICQNKDGKIHFLMFGVIRHYKGLDILLNAIANIPPQDRERMEFVIAGRQYHNQNDTDYNKIVNNLGISDCVRLVIRHINDCELPELFGWADACIFPYTEIYGSGALLMAYAYNLPVIVSDVPVFVEETNNGKTGLLFKNRDSKSLSETIISFSLLKDDDKQAMKDEIQYLVEHKYNWHISAKMTENIYKNI